MTEIMVSNKWTIAKLKYELFFLNIIDAEGHLFFKHKKLVNNGMTMTDVGIGHKSTINVIKNEPKQIEFGSFLTRYTPVF